MLTCPELTCSHAHLPLSQMTEKYQTITATDMLATVADGDSY